MKMSLFAWGILVQSFMIIVAMPTFSAAMIMMYTDRLGVSGFFNPAMGGDPIAYQHLFWFTFHPEVYIFLLPAIGMAYEIIPKFSRKPIFSYQSGVTAFVMLGTIGFASWAHHMFATGMSFTEKTVFMIGTLAAVPASAMHVFNFVATMWGGRIKFAAPMLFTVGGIMLFYAAGAGGVVNTAIPLDFLTHDSYFVVGHFHLFMMGTVTMIFTGVIYYLFPLITGRNVQRKGGPGSVYSGICRYCSSLRHTTPLRVIRTTKAYIRLHSSSSIHHNESNCNNRSLDCGASIWVDAS